MATLTVRDLDEELKGRLRIRAARRSPPVIVLDTNVLSELVRTIPEPRVVAWVDGQDEPTALTAITVAELLSNVARLPAGRRRTALADTSGELIDTVFAGTGVDVVNPWDDASVR